MGLRIDVSRFRAFLKGRLWDFKVLYFICPDMWEPSTFQLNIFRIIGGMLQPATGLSLCNFWQAWPSDPFWLMWWATTSPGSKLMWHVLYYICITFATYMKSIWHMPTKKLHRPRKFCTVQDPISSFMRISWCGNNCVTEAALASCAWQSLWRSATSLMHRSHLDHVADPVTTNTVARRTCV